MSMFEPLSFTHVFRCDAASGYIIAGLLISAAATALILHRFGIGSYVGRLYFALGTTLGVFAGATAFWLLHDRCI